MLATVLADTTTQSRTALGIGLNFGALAVNSATGNYLAVGAHGVNNAGAAMNTDGAELDANGNVVARGLITSTFDTVTSNAGVMDLSYSPVAGTFVLSGLNRTVFPRTTSILELNQHGVAMPGALTLPFSLAIESHATAPEWIVPSASSVVVIVGTSTPFGGSDARLSGCTTPDPFVVLGGGVCVNSGWVPRGHPLVPPNSGPAPTPGNCTTPDPFVTMGGGVCVNGGWVPRGHPLAPPPNPQPSPTPGTCTMPDPFTTLGGGVCINGGWVPKNHPLAASRSGG